MELGFETIGNATLLCHDRGPLLVTDPWIQGHAYFGSWCLSHKIPDDIRQSILECPFVFFSHGHPDHLNPESLPLFKGKSILLPHHYGGRVQRELAQQGFQVRVLPDAKWVSLSDRVRVMALPDRYQDAMLLVDLDGTLVINVNDAVDFWRPAFIRRIAREAKTSFLLSISGFGEADMIHFYDENGQFIPPEAERRIPIGPQMAAKAERFGARYFVPFSSFHRFSRTDSDWMNKYTARMDEYSEGFESKTAECLHAFLRYDCRTQKAEAIRPEEEPLVVHPPEHFGDNWEEPLRHGDTDRATRYFRSFEHLVKTMRYVRLRVGKKDDLIPLGGPEAPDRGLTIEAPRHSLMAAIEYEIFDDLLIGNFAKATLHGDWPASGLYPDFSPYVTKYGDNGRAKTEDELDAYFRHYEARVIQGPWRKIERGLARGARRILPPNAFQALKRAFGR